jgi:hypothetical protein
MRSERQTDPHSAATTILLRLSHLRGTTMKVISARVGAEVGVAVRALNRMRVELVRPNSVHIA